MLRLGMSSRRIAVRCSLFAVLVPLLTACGTRTELTGTFDSAICSRGEVVAPTGWSAPSACAPPGASCPEECFEAPVMISDCANSCGAMVNVACLPRAGLRGLGLCVVNPQTGDAYFLNVGTADVTPPPGFRTCTDGERMRFYRIEQDVGPRCELR